MKPGYARVSAPMAAPLPEQYLADALTGPSEVLSIVAGWIVLRSAAAGFWVLLRGGDLMSARSAAADLAFASFPSAALVGMACVLYLLVEG
jgi:hypothetical protein